MLKICHIAQTGPIMSPTYKATSDTAKELKSLPSNLDNRYRTIYTTQVNAENTDIKNKTAINY